MYMGQGMEGIGRERGVLGNKAEIVGWVREAITEGLNEFEQ